jgi:hypothetical protein
MRYRETSPPRHVPFRGNGCGPGPELVAQVEPSDKAPTWGPSSCQRINPHRSIDLSPLPDQKPGRGSSHRQRQYLLVEFANSLGMADRNSEQVRRKLADTGAALSGHFPQAGVNDCCGTYFDLFSITFVRLGHRPDLVADQPCTWYRHAVANGDFVKF